MRAETASLPSEESTPPQLIKSVAVDEFVKNTLGDLLSDLKTLCTKPVDQPPHPEAASTTSDKSFHAAADPLDGDEAHLMYQAALPATSPASGDLPSCSLGEAPPIEALFGAQASLSEYTHRSSAGLDTTCRGTRPPLTSMTKDIKGIEELLSAILEENPMQRLKQIEQSLESLVQQRTVKEKYSTVEMAQIVGKKEYTIREHCRLGRIRAEKKPCGRGSGEWLIPHAELERFRSEGPLPFPPPPSA